ncbi:MAG: hypothetical protein NTZ46_10135 [Verrucomicrobia bacterium]|nr:hypothetical protein [Verrucomicrobiota bacterium]
MISNISSSPDTIILGILGGIFWLIPLAATIFLLVLAARFVKAHERIAHAMNSMEQAHREAAVALRKLAATQNNKDNQS